ncbi:MAG: SDR family NAD(P)-dependent oxidoreductase, partial [Alphaproteobacteria bacterium]
MDEHRRTAIVTGAGKRVGAVLAYALVERGWSVIGHVRDAADEVPDGARKVVADLAQLDCAERIFRAAEGLPPVRLLVNNAARFASDGFDSFNPRELQAHMDVNLRAP